MPLLALGFVLTLFLREVALSDVAAMVARGEAVGAPAAHHGVVAAAPGADHEVTATGSTPAEPAEEAPAGRR